GGGGEGGGGGRAGTVGFGPGLPFGAPPAPRFLSWLLTAEKCWGAISIPNSLRMYAVPSCGPSLPAARARRTASALVVTSLLAADGSSGASCDSSSGSTGSGRAFVALRAMMHPPGVLMLRAGGYRS